MKFAIGLAEGMQLSPAQYLAALRKAIENPDGRFRQSFQDPTGWMGGHTGREIVGEWKMMLARRWKEQWRAVRTWGKGNGATRRHASLRACAWCGTRKPTVRNDGRWFYDAQCARSHES